MPKRYLLFYTTSDQSDDDLRRLAEIIRRWDQTAKVIQVKRNPRAVIIKTTNQTATVLRDIKPGVRLNGVDYVPVLTSGSIGNLKKRASEAATNGKVP